MQITNDLTFASYIDNCQEVIRKGRNDFANYSIPAEKIITANSPFELYPNQKLATGKKYPYGALLIHGLFDCPFSMLEIAQQLQQQGVPSKAILLPGHGTKPQDLLKITYRDWLAAMRFGIQAMQQEVEKLILVGYSTGAALAVYHALEEEDIAGMILIAPAIKIKAPIRLISAMQQIKGILGHNRDWILQENEIDYVKYRSIPFSPVYQVATLAAQNTIKHAKQALYCPVLMIISDADETISSKHALHFFNATSHIKSQMLLYTSKKIRHKDPRIETRNAKVELHIKHFSHVALPFSEYNSHYGLNGDFPLAPNNDRPYIYGAFNRMTVRMYDMLYRYGLIKQPRRGLTYNPDFNYMMSTIQNFIQDC